MSLPPIQLSEIIIQHPEVNSFGELLALLRSRAETGERVFLEFDLKPEYPDTPRNWAMLVEEAFTYGDR